MSMVKEQEAVYILNRRPYQETSLLVDIFSLNYGRFTAVAKGAMRKGNEWSSCLQAFQPLLISWSGRSTLKTLRSVDVPCAAYRLSSSYLFSAYYLNELLIKLLPENEVNETIFAAYVSCLTRLSELDNIQHSLRSFEIIVLEELGMLPDFSYDIDGNQISNDCEYQLLYQQGFKAIDRLNDNRRTFCTSGRVIGLLRHTSDEPSKQWQRNDYLQAKHLMRCLVDDALGGQTIKSRELFKPIKFER